MSTQSAGKSPGLGRRAARLPLLLLKLLLVLLAAALFWAVVVMAQTDPEDEVPPAFASPALSDTTFAQEGDFLAAAQQAPYAVLAYPYGVGVPFTGGSFRCLNSPQAEVWSVDYTTPQGIRVNVRTIVPNTAVSLLDTDGYTLASAAPMTLSGVPMARLANGRQVLYYGKSSSALYAITLPGDIDERAALQSLQLLAHQ